jgi:hypothetical protein
MACSWHQFTTDTSDLPPGTSTNVWACSTVIDTS